MHMSSAGDPPRLAFPSTHRCTMSEKTSCYSNVPLRRSLHAARMLVQINPSGGQRMRLAKMSNGIVRAGAATAFVAAGVMMVASVAPARAAVVTANASDNATVRPAGPRAPTGGKTFFNVEVDSNATNASYGILDFTGS